MPFDWDNTEVIHQSRRPLRWIANWAGSIASSGIIDASYMEDNGGDTFKYRFNLWKWNTFYPIYKKYGTYYKMNWDLSGPAWDDYDDNGVPYWDKWELWDYEDEETGDAFRIISHEK